MANPFCHLELNATDSAKAREFYGAMFDWKLEALPGAAVDAYTLVNTGSAPGGGIMPKMPGGPAGWVPYVLVDEIHEAVKKAGALGATVLKGVGEVPEMGWFAFIADPNGAILGLWQAKTR